MEVLEKIKLIKLVPVTIFNNKEEIRPTLSALQKGGVLVTEICFRTEYAEEGIKIACKEYPDMLVGAGTVINKDQCQKAIDAGAKFIVSPGFSDEVCDLCQSLGVLYVPGVVTPTEIMHALDKNITYLKFFPAGVYGGLKAIKALSAAFPQVYFLPTGGVDNSNLKEFIEHKKIFAVGGSWLLKGDIAANCLEAMKIIKGE